MKNSELLEKLNSQQALLDDYNKELERKRILGLSGTSLIVQSIIDCTREIEFIIQLMKNNNSKDIEYLEKFKIIDVKASITKKSPGMQDTTQVTILAQMSNHNENVIDLSFADTTISVTREDLSVLANEFEF